ncbi:hypothetical protein Dimus_018973 [Dionaea muscipula]
MAPSLDLMALRGPFKLASLIFSAVRDVYGFQSFSPYLEVVNHRNADFDHAYGTMTFIPPSNFFNTTPASISSAVQPVGGYSGEGISNSLMETWLYFLVILITELMEYHMMKLRILFLKDHLIG